MGLLGASLAGERTANRPRAARLLALLRRPPPHLTRLELLSPSTRQPAAPLGSAAHRASMRGVARSGARRDARSATATMGADHTRGHRDRERLLVVRHRVARRGRSAPVPAPAG